MPTVDCETSEEYFYDSEQSLASEASEDSFHSANEVFFHRTMKELTSGDFSLYSCLIGGSSKYARNNAYTVITVQAEVAQRANNSHPTDKSLSSYSKN